MRRRQSDIQLPAELLEFDGITLGYTTPESWRAALAEWEAARARWASEHGVVEELPGNIGDEPWDPSII